MKKYVWTGAAIVVVFVGLWLWLGSGDTQEIVYEPEPSSVEETYELSAQGLSFAYLRGEDGYVLEDRDVAEMYDAELVRFLVLTPTRDHEDQQSRIGGEGSPAWTLAIYTNDLNQSASEWASANPNESNIGMAVDGPREEVVGGANAITYTVDGLYRMNIYVVASNDLIYVATSAYLDEMSQTYRELDAWLDSFEFIPMAVDGPSQGKIDPRAACESALAYMTFSSGEEADAFVEACVAGGHPEVIERYIEDMGLDGASI